MTSKLFQLACPALVALALCIRAGAAEPTIVAPESVPVGGLAMVRVDGLEADAKFSWTAVPPVQTADLMQRDGTPVLFVSTAVAGKHWIILAYLDGGEVRQQTTTLTIGGGPGPQPVPPGPGPSPVEPGPTPSTATAVAFVYEKDQHAIPGPVLAALNRLNRERGIVATVLEADPDDGTGEVPEQYKAALAAAKQAGLPCLVVSGAAGIIKIVPNPTTEAAVMEAVP